jgi:hypothetical protein
MELLLSAATSRRKNRIGDRMARDKKTIGVDASEEVVNAFEAGIVFGRMVESRRPKRHPLWSDEEWLQALTKAVRKKATSQVG